MRTLRRALRGLWQARAFTFTVVLTLGMGVGLTNAIFTVVDSVLLRPLGYRDADRIVALESHLPDRAEPGNWIGGDDYTDLVQQVRGLESAAYLYTFGETGLRVGGEADYARVAAASPSFGQVFGVEPMTGRLFNPQDTYGSGALVSSNFARSHFGSATAALGRVVEAESMTRTVVGVLPPGFDFPERTEVWLELAPRPETGSRSSGNQTAVGRRRETVSAAALRTELAMFSRRLQTSFPEDRGKTIEAVPLRDQIVGRVQPTLRLLMGSVLLVLLIVCTNLAHMQLARSTGRQRTASVRIAIGASKWSLAAGSLAESVLLAIGGSVLAAMLGIPALYALLRLAPADMPRLAEVHPDFTVSLLSLLLSIMLMVGTALLPLLRLWRANAASLLKSEDKRGSDGPAARRFRSGLLMGEIAFTLVLSVGSILLARQLLAQSRVDLGFDAQHLVTLDTHLTGGPVMPEEPGNASPEQKTAYLSAAAKVAEVWRGKIDALLTATRAVPGVSSVAAIEGAPMGFGAVDVRYAIRGQQVFDSSAITSLPVAFVHAISPDLFATLGTPLLGGRAFDAGDHLGTPSVVIISAALARERFAGQNPLGRQITCGYDWDTNWWTVIGIAADIHADAPGSAPVPTLYVPLAQHPEKASDLQLLVHTRGDPAAITSALTRNLRHSFPDAAIRESTMAENIGAVERLDQLRTVVFGSFGGVSLMLAAVGIYGITAYSVAQRRFEFGLRLAVGAQRRQLLNMVLGEALRLALAGVGLGGMASLALTKVLGSVVGDLPAFNAWIYALASLALLSLAATAALVPARRAAAAEPMEVLRYE